MSTNQGAPISEFPRDAVYVVAPGDEDRAKMAAHMAGRDDLRVLRADRVATWRGHRATVVVDPSVVLDDEAAAWVAAMRGEGPPPRRIAAPAR